jgi:hypothetical protein
MYGVGHFLLTTSYGPINSPFGHVLGIMLYVSFIIMLVCLICALILIHLMHLPRIRYLPQLPWGSAFDWIAPSL